MDPDAVECEERPPGRPGPRCRRASEVGSELTEDACQGKPFVDVPQDSGQAAWLSDDGLGKALYLEPKVKPDEQLISGVAAAMRDFLKFHNATTLVTERSEPASFGKKLLKAL